MSEIYNKIKELEEEISGFAAKLETAREEIAKSVIGQNYMIDRLLIGLLTGGHILLEGLPGLAKTLSVNTLAKTINADFKRIQFTPDMLPADLVGTNIFNPSDGSFSAKKGPLFSNLVLADEINRAPAKVQSALLEVMQEKQVTIADQTFKLSEPFLVLATQNPIEQEGTYPLPEAQVDRFMMKLKVEYPKKEEERALLDRFTSFSHQPEINQMLSVEDILEMRSFIERVYIDEKIKDYIVDLTYATRTPHEYGLDELTPLIEVGASPRATITLAIAARAAAFLAGRGFVTPDDVKYMAHDVLRHRIIISYEAEAEEKTSDQIINSLLSGIPVY